jgi:hypothetical protein
MPTRWQKRWGPRLRTAGALLLLASAVALADRLIPRAPDPVLGRERSLALFGVAAALGLLGSISFWLGRRWR